MTLARLTEHLRRTAALEQAAGLLAWDREVTMPPRGAAQRARQAAALAGALHARRTDPRLPDWIAAAEAAAETPADRRNVAEARRTHARASRIPARLAEELAHAASEGQTVWIAAREASDFAAFAPALARMVALKREEAACLAEPGGELYDPLLDQFEPGARTADLAPMLDGLRPRLVALRERIDGRPVPPGLSGAFPAERQIALAGRVAARLGFDFERGRLDLAVHPSCSGAGDDVRITTRIDEADPLDCLLSTIHETGHALYEQGLPDPGLPAGQHCSMAVHESQARFWENQIARSRPFADWLHPALEAEFGTAGVPDPDALHAAMNRVETGFIRTEADEVHYNLHIILRFDIERSLIDGEMEADDLETAWNDRFARDFGVEVPEARLGALQDVHWSLGLFGYFPTYALGNIHAACLDRAMRADLPERDAMVRAAETGPILDWMRERVHAKGRLLPAPELIERATGAQPTAGPLLDYLEAKFGALYDL